MACFTEGRKRFGDPGQKVPGHVNLIDYFFDKDVLTPYSYMPNNRYDIFFRELNIKNSARTIPKEVFLFFFRILSDIYESIFLFFFRKGIPDVWHRTKMSAGIFLSVY